MPKPQRLQLSQVAALLPEILERGENAAVVVVISHPDPGQVGSRVLVTESEGLGSVGDPEADAQAVTLARRALAGDPGLPPDTYGLPLGDGGTVEVFLDLHHPPWELIIVGAGHVAQPLCAMGSLLGLQVTVLDDRPQFATRERFPEAREVAGVDFSDPFAGRRLHRWSHVVLVTRGHKYDFECLRKVLMAEPLPGYVGMIGSRRRVKATFDALLADGFSTELLRTVHAPIGLDLGAETPAEIALSIAAELVHSWRGGTGRPLRELENLLDRFYRGEGRPTDGNDPTPLPHSIPDAVGPDPGDEH
jgi:xanthine dehydrogenase accessory factor